MISRVHRLVGISAAAVLTVALSGCGGGGEDDGTVSMGVYPASVLSLPAFVGESTGIFEDNGLTVDFVDGKSGPELTSALLGGTTQIALGLPSTVVPAIQQGQALMSVPPYGGIDYTIAATDVSGIKTLADLPGKRVAVPARGSAVEQYVSQMLTEEGIDPGTVTFIAAGPTAGQIPIIRKGDVDAAILSYSSLELFEQEGLSLNVIANPSEGTAGEVGKYALGSFFMTTKEIRDSKPDTIGKVCAAFRDVAQWLADPANADAGAEIVAKETGLNSDSAAQVYTKEAALWSDSLSPERWQENVDWVTSNSEGGSTAPAPLDSACA